MVQVRKNARGYLLKQIMVQSLIKWSGDIHHVLPNKYLQKNGVNNCQKYKQIDNDVSMLSETNINIMDDAPCEYMACI